MSIKLLQTFAFMVLIFQTSEAQTILWGGPNDPNSTFSNGIGNWSTVGLSSSKADSIQNAVWTYAANGTSKGAYSNEAGSILSPSKADGAMIFDSDFLDNGGIENNEGQGSAPSPHSGALVSPLINCSGFTSSVAVSFYQYFQNYVAECFLEVSNDSGKTWTIFPINQNILEGTGTSRSNRQVIDISSVAVGKKDVQFRFVFDGDYYFWMVDDVTLVSLPDLDLAINSVYYSPSTYAQPKSQICNDTFKFSARVSNLGGMVQRDLKFKVTLFGADRQTVLFQDSSLVANLALTDDNISVSTPNYFVPSSLDYGKYFIRWSFTGGQGTEYNAVDNSKIDSFEVTVSQYAREPRPRGGIRANGGISYSVATLYNTSDCWNGFDKFAATSADFAVAYDRLATLNNYNMQIFLLAVKDEVNADFSNFEKMGGVSGISTELVSEEIFKGGTQPSYSLLNQPLTDVLTGGQVVLKPNKRYFLVAQHPDEPSSDPNTWRYHASSLEKNYSGHPFNSPVIDNIGVWYESWPGNESPVLRLNITILTKNDETSLGDNVIQVYPNPIQNGQLKLELNFEKETNANLTLFDLNGRVLNFLPYKNVTFKNIQIPVDGLDSGEYFIRVSTDEGTKTKKFVVVK